MNETPAPVTAQPVEPHKTLIVILTLVATVIAAIIATLQADANIRANQANRDSQYYAILASGELHRSSLQGLYDMNTAAKVAKETQTALIMQFTSFQNEQSGETSGSTLNELEAMAAQARADRLKIFSILFTDPRYAPTTADGLPNAERYIADLNARAKELVQLQNIAADNYQHWNRKADSYVSVLAVLALTFFLLGLAQAITGKMRLLFSIFGSVMLFGATLWATIILFA